MARYLSAVLVAPDATTEPRGAAIVRKTAGRRRRATRIGRARIGPERDRIYKLLRPGGRCRPDWSLQISGIFVEVAEEAENDLSYCKLS